MRRCFLFFLLWIALLSADGRKTQGPVFILHSDKGSLQMVGKYEALLLMQEVDQTVPFVYSHPVRRIGAEHLTEFMRVWAAGGQLQYDKDPPDAHLLYYDTHEGDYVDFFIELLDTSYEADMNSLTFKIRFFNDRVPNKEDLGEVTLFVDCFPYCV